MIKLCCFFVCFFFYTVTLSAQSFVVNNIQSLEQDLTGRMNQRVDKVGIPCAVLKIHISVDAKFKGDIYGKILKTGNEYTIYISTKAKELVIFPENGETLNINLSYYPCYPYIPNMCYVIDIVSVNDIKLQRNLDYLSLEQLHQYAEDGDVSACFYLAKAYCLGTKGASIDYVEGYKWMKKAAENNHVDAQCELAKFYFNGIGNVKRNIEEAYIWFEKAANGGNGNAQFMMASKYFTDYENMSYDDMQKAKYWLNKALENNFYKAYVYLVMICIKEGDYDAAIDYAKKLAFWGDSYGQLILGQLYNKEDTKYYDQQKSRFWIELAAEGGNPQAQYILGKFYENDSTDIKNIDKAIYWYRQGAKNGDEDAKMALKRLGK